ncbi:MAG: TAXI family TRAP transporter solute-binding subunit [Rhodospirillaceae bacterium]
MEHSLRTRPRYPPLVAGLLTIAFVTAGTVACSRPAAPLARRVIRLTTGTPGARFHPLGQALTRAYSAAFPSFDVRPVDSAGSIANVEALQRGDADVGLSYADVAYMAYVGGLDGRQEAFANLRGIAVLELAPVHLVVRPGSTISDAAGLRGMRIAVGPAGSGSAFTADIVLRALGIASTAHVEPMKYNDAAARLAAGTIDALFVTGTDPVDAVQSATRAGARLLPLGGPAIVRLRHDYPFFRSTLIHGGTYPGHPDPIRTIGVDNLLVCRRGLDEDTVHDLAQQLFAQLPSMSILIGMDLEQAPATPIPLHDGAARYYRERELAR